MEGSKVTVAREKVVDVRRESLRSAWLGWARKTTSPLWAYDISRSCAVVYGVTSSKGSPPSSMNPPASAKRTFRLVKTSTRRRPGTYFLEELGEDAVLLPFQFSSDPS